MLKERTFTSVKSYSLQQSTPWEVARNGRSGTRTSRYTLSWKHRFTYLQYRGTNQTRTIPSLWFQYHCHFCLYHSLVTCRNTALGRLELRQEVFSTDSVRTCSHPPVLPTYTHANSWCAYRNWSNSYSYFGKCENSTHTTDFHQEQYKT